MGILKIFNVIFVTVPKRNNTIPQIFVIKQSGSLSRDPKMRIKYRAASSFSVFSWKHSIKLNSHERSNSKEFLGNDFLKKFLEGTGKIGFCDRILQ